MAQKFLQDDFFNPAADKRKEYDEKMLQSAYKGPLTTGKIIAPNLYPIPLFVIGGYTMRQAAMTLESDVGGGAWMRDSSFLWMDSLATFDLGMSALAGVSTFYAFRLSSCGIRRRITTKQAYLKDCQNIFFNPVGDVKIQFVKPRSRDFIRDGLFLSHQLRPQPAQILSFGVASLAAAGVVSFQSYFAIPAVVSYYIFLYMIVRGSTEVALFHPALRAITSSEPAFDKNSNSTSSLLTAALKVYSSPSKDMSVDEFYRQKYPFMFENTRPYKYRVALKEPMMYINVGPNNATKEESDGDQMQLNENDFK